jgi:hypothetical protein
MAKTHVIWREAMRNAVLPTLTLVGVQFTFLIGGTVIIERLFSYEGLGNMAIDAVINRDLPLIQGIVLMFCGAVHGDQPDRRHDLCAAESRGCAMLDGRGSVKRRAGRGCGCQAGGWPDGAAALFAPLISPHDPLAQDLFASDGCRRSGSMGPSRATARHRQSRPRRAVAHHPRRAHRVGRGAGGRCSRRRLIGSLLGLLAGYFAAGSMS